MKKFILLGIGVLVGSLCHTYACTGISFQSQDGAHIVARTIEWAATPTPAFYVVTPRGHSITSYTPSGTNGLSFTSRYGSVGLATQQAEFIAEGINEAGLSAGLFFFPRYGDYGVYHKEHSAQYICDLQVVSWLLASFATIDEVKEGMKDVKVVSVNPDPTSALHWRIADASGRQVVMEITHGGEVHFFENTVGVLTNSPGFEWHLTNLNNYIGLHTGYVAPKQIGQTVLHSLGVGAGLSGLPGDVTPPSRFVRAYFYTATSAQPKTALSAITQSFHILNNFDIPLGLEHVKKSDIPDMPSTTQWTTATDISNRMIYYRTAYNSQIRCIDLNSINFKKVKYQVHPLDDIQEEKIEFITIR